MSRPDMLDDIFDRLFDALPACRDMKPSQWNEIRREIYQNYCKRQADAWLCLVEEV